MKNRFMYSIVLATVLSQGAYAQEFSADQQVGPGPYDTLPAAILSEQIVVPSVPTAPEMPKAPEPLQMSEDQPGIELNMLPIVDVSDEDNSIALPVTAPAGPFDRAPFDTAQDRQGRQMEANEPVQINEQPKVELEIMPALDLSKTGTASINIGLDENKRKEVVSALGVLLSDEYLLYTKTLKYHWNVKGPHFGPLHEFFGKQYEALQGFIDGVAERIRMLDFMPPATLAEFTKLATLHEQVGHNPNDLGMIADLLADHEQIIRNLRGYIDLSAKVNDMGTNNFLADLIEKHEKMAWMLRAHLAK